MKCFLETPPTASFIRMKISTQKIDFHIEHAFHLYLNPNIKNSKKNKIFEIIHLYPNRQNIRSF